MANDVKPSPNKIPQCNFNHLSLLFRMFLAELLGLAAVCFIAVIYQNGTLPGPIVVGLTFCWIAWVFGPVSGAQVNPVVSMALLFTRRLSVVHAVVCVVGQFIGAIIGAWIGKLAGPSSFFADNTIGMTLRNPSITQGQAIGLEIIGTMFVLLTVLAMADEFRTKPWAQGHVSMFPFAFGATLALVASVVGIYTGASMNPARSIGPAIVNNNYTEQWIYFVGPVVGALLAALLYEMVLSDGASLARLKAWFTETDFDRNQDYTNGDDSSMDAV